MIEIELIVSHFFKMNMIIKTQFYYYVFFFSSLNLSFIVNKFDLIYDINYHQMNTYSRDIIIRNMDLQKIMIYGQNLLLIDMRQQLYQNFTYFTESMMISSLFYLGTNNKKR